VCPRSVHQPTHCSPIVLRVTETPCYASLPYFSYALLGWPHSPRLLTSRMRCLSAVIFADLRLNVWQKRPVRHHWPTSRTRCLSALILLAGLHLVPVACLPSFSTLRVRVGRLTSFLLTCIRTCGRNAVLGITGLQLVPVAHLPSFSSLAYISYTLLVCRHSPRWPTSRTLVYRHSPRWPTSRTRCSSAVILLAGLHLILVCRHSPRWPTSRTGCSSTIILYASRTCWSFDVIFADLRSNVWQKRRVMHYWPTTPAELAVAFA